MPLLVPHIIHAVKSLSNDACLSIKYCSKMPLLVPIYNRNNPIYTKSILFLGEE